jgi:DNA-binding YbaB/EbfC family protein
MATFFDFIKQAHLFQERWAQLQQEAAKKTVEASVGGGMVTVVANGRLEILSIKIDPELVKLKDIAMLQDLIVAAVNEARR